MNKKSQKRLLYGLIIGIFLISIFSLCLVIAPEVGKENSTITYTSSTDTSCINGKCNLILYSGIRNVYEDNKWKRVEDARSLKGKGFEIVYLGNSI